MEMMAEMKNLTPGNKAKILRKFCADNNLSKKEDVVEALLTEMRKTKPGAPKWSAGIFLAELITLNCLWFHENKIRFDPNL